MERERFFEAIRKVPKAEIHLHLEDFIAEQSEKVSSLPEFLVEVRSAQNSRKEIGDFHRTFRRIARYLKTNGIVYAEISFSVPRYLNNGFIYPEMIKYFEAQIERIKREDNITIKLIADVSRTYGVESANHVLDLVIKHKSRDIIGIGLGGDEKLGPAKNFANIFKRARENGLHTVAHAGESDDYQSVLNAIKYLGAQRIGHGIAAAYDAATMELLKTKNIPLEVAPTSNIVTGHIVKTLPEHPIKRLHENGVLVTLNSDDPNLFNTSLTQEYWNLHNAMDFEFEQLYIIIINGFRAAFITDIARRGYIKAANKQWSRMLALEQRIDDKSWQMSCQTLFDRIE